MKKHDILKIRSCMANLDFRIMKERGSPKRNIQIPPGGFILAFSGFFPP